MNETQPVLALRSVQVPDWPALVEAYGDADLDSPRRSTVPLVAWSHRCRCAPGHRLFDKATLA
jgi:hypothetical protein